MRSFVKIASVVLLLASVPAALAFSPPKKDTVAAAATTEEAAGTSVADDPLLAGADIERGKAVYQRIGICISCHGWDGNGMGKNPRSEGAAAHLRETQLDTQGLMDVIKCGLPGTPMPYHFSSAYREPEICFGAVMADFEPGTEPRKGKTFRDKDLVNLVAYMKTAIIGAGETTLEQCEAFFEPGSKACDNLR
jgi:cytochrome c553